MSVLKYSSLTIFCTLPDLSVRRYVFDDKVVAEGAVAACDLFSEVMVKLQGEDGLV